MPPILQSSPQSHTPQPGTLYVSDEPQITYSPLEPKMTVGHKITISNNDWFFPGLEWVERILYNPPEDYVLKSLGSCSGRAQTSTLANKAMSTSLTICEWKKVFYEKMEVAKPADSWELIIDPTLKFNELAPGWKQYLEQHASGRYHCSWCWHTWQSAHVVILFHMHLDRSQRKGSVRMRVFKQLCCECGTARLDESSMLEENIESLVDNLITSLREQCYGEDGGQYRIHVASRPDSGPHLSELCEACQEGIVHWKPSEKLLEEEATTYTSDASKPRAQEGSGYSFFSLRWCLFWASLCLLVVYLLFSFRSSAIR